MLPTIEEAISYLGIDYPDAVSSANATRCLATAIITLKGAVGDDVEDLLPGDSRVKELVLIYTDDLYSNRGTSAKVTGATRRMVQDMELQLRMELRRKRAEVADV